MASGGTRTAAPVVTPVVAAAVPAATTARGAVTRVRGDVRGLRAARVRGGNRASARVSGRRPRGRGKKRGASPPPDAAAATCRTRNIARAHERFPTSRRGHAPRGGRGGTAAAAAASAAAPRGGRGEVAGVVSPRHGRGWWCLEEKDACSERRSDRTGRRVGATNRARDLDCRESEVLTDAAYVRLFSRRGVAGAVRVECGGRDAGAARSQTLSSKPRQNAALSRRTKPHRSARPEVHGLAATSAGRIFQSLFTHTNSCDVFCGPRTREKRRTPSFSVSGGGEARRRGAASSNAGRARLARGSAVARRAAQFSARTPDAATPKRRHLARPRVARGGAG